MNGALEEDLEEGEKYRVRSLVPVENYWSGHESDLTVEVTNKDPGHVEIETSEYFPET